MYPLYRPPTVPAVINMELSAVAYDEIERKLLNAGYDFLFSQGPGSPVCVCLVLTREGEHERDAST